MTLYRFLYNLIEGKLNQNEITREICRLNACRYLLNSNICRAAVSIASLQIRIQQLHAELID